MRRMSASQPLAQQGAGPHQIWKMLQRERQPTGWEVGGGSFSRELPFASRRQDPAGRATWFALSKSGGLTPCSQAEVRRKVLSAAPPVGTHTPGVGGDSTRAWDNTHASETALHCNWDSADPNPFCL